MSLKDKEFNWEEILGEISKKQCTPIVGEEASFPHIPPSKETAVNWAKTYHYPLEDSYQLSRVAQFLAINEGDESSPKRKLFQEVGSRNPPNFSTDEHKYTPYTVLANLNLPIYITTNYDLFMEAALKDHGKSPVSEFCRWNDPLIQLQEAGIPSVLPIGKHSKSTKYNPTDNKPLVYHLYGLYRLSREYRPDDGIERDTPESLVLTEKDYIDFALKLHREADDTLPTRIRNALALSSLLFIGYGLDDLSFRILFQGVINWKTKALGKILTVQVLPEYNTVRATKYLQQYADKMFKVRVYWGSPSEFCKTLRQRWENLNTK